MTLIVVLLFKYRWKACPPGAALEDDELKHVGRLAEVKILVMVIMWALLLR